MPGRQQHTNLVQALTAKVSYSLERSLNKHGPFHGFFALFLHISVEVSWYLKTTHTPACTLFTAGCAMPDNVLQGVLPGFTTAIRVHDFVRDLAQKLHHLSSSDLPSFQVSEAKYQ